MDASPTPGGDAIDLRLEGAGSIEAFGEEAGEHATESLGTRDEPPGASSLTYESHYGLTQKAFSLSPDPRFVHVGAPYGSVLRELVAAVRRREGLVVLTGDIGTGKTTLCRAMIDRLEQKTFTSVVSDPFASREDLLKTMLVDFGVMSVDDLVKGRVKGATRPDLSFPLSEFLRSIEPLDASAVLVIEEAHNLSLPLLEEIRILSDLEGGRKLLQIVLVGQPELDEQLCLPRMRQIQQRISVHCHLPSLDRDQVADYVSHRLRVAGATPERVRVSPEALDLVSAASGGVPRIVNLLCDKALLHGHARQVTCIDVPLVRRAMADLRLRVPAEPSSVDPAAAPPARDGATSPSATRRDAPAGSRAGDGGAEAGPARAPAATNSLARGKVWLGTPRLRPAAAMALVVLGITTGLSVVGYWVWLRPVWSASAALPPIRPARTMPFVPSPIAEPLVPGDGTGQALAEPAIKMTSPPLPAADGDVIWTIQAGTFSDAARAASVVERLEQLNFPSFERALDVDGGRFRVAFAGPYGSREAAAAALEDLRRMPGFEGALVRPLAP